VTFDYDKSDISDTYGKSRELPKETIDLWLNVIRSRVGFQGGRILDLGCGEGRFSVPLGIRFHAVIYGIDPSRKMLSIASKRERFGAQVHYAVGAAERIPFVSDVMSLVFMSMVYHHLDRVSEAVSEIKRILAPGRHVVVRNSTRGNTLENGTFDCFPSARKLESNRMPDDADVVLSFERGGLVTVSSEDVKQVFAQNYEEYYQKLAGRALSGLRLIPDPEFESGLRDLKLYCDKKPRGTKVYERVHLFTFSRD